MGKVKTWCDLENKHYLISSELFVPVLLLKAVKEAKVRKAGVHNFVWVHQVGKKNLNVQVLLHFPQSVNSPVRGKLQLHSFTSIVSIWTHSKELLGLILALQGGRWWGFKRSHRQPTKLNSPLRSPENPKQECCSVVAGAPAGYGINTLWWGEESEQVRVWLESREKRWTAKPLCDQREPLKVKPPPSPGDHSSGSLYSSWAHILPWSDVKCFSFMLPSKH